MARPSVANSLLRHQLDLLRVEAAQRRAATRAINSLARELERQLRRRDITAFSRQRMNDLLRHARSTIEEAYGRIDRSVAVTLRGVADVSARRSAQILERAHAALDMTATLPTQAFVRRMVDDTMIMGAPSAEWWERQSRDAAFRFSAAVRQGLAGGETAEQIARRAAESIGVARSNARSLIHTSVQTVAARARRETFRKNDDVVSGTRQVSTLDSNTTEICQAYDGAEYNLDGEPINGTTLPYNGGVPRHWGCRSVEVPITKTFRELGLDIDEPDEGERASSDGPVPGDWTFSDFLESMPKEEQDEALGPGRAELWREGKITLQQLLDQDGNPLTLAELRERYDE